MDQQQQQKFLSFIPLGGPEEVTRNMYVYEYGDEILVAECGIGFTDETMLGVDLQLPDISYLMQTEKRVVGMILSHGHEDHIGAVPFLLPELQKKHGRFPVYASRLTAALTNEKLKEFRMDPEVKTVDMDGGDNTVSIGEAFKVTFIRITHSVPDSSHMFIETPIGNFYHAADYKFDMTPYDGKISDYKEINKTGQKGVLCLLSDCLNVEQPGFSRTEAGIGANIDRAMEECKGKFILTTYSSNIARLNQTIAAAERHKRKVCFVGRSLIKVKDIGLKLELLKMDPKTEVTMEELHDLADNQLVLLVAGSQGQENSALTRIGDGEHKDIKVGRDDVVVFSSDAIPGNEISVYALIDTLSKRGAKVFFSGQPNPFHVSGHGSAGDRQLLIGMTKPKFLIPISGNYRHMVKYKELAEGMGFRGDQVPLVSSGQEMIFTPNGVRPGKKIPIKNVYIDQISGEEVESFVLRDRERLAHDGIVVVLTEVTADDGQLADNFGIITRGFLEKDSEFLEINLKREIAQKLMTKHERINNWVHIRKQIENIATKYIDHKLRRRPLVMSVVIEV